MGNTPTRLAAAPEHKPNVTLRGLASLPVIAG